MNRQPQQDKSKQKTIKNKQKNYTTHKVNCEHRT